MTPSKRLPALRTSVEAGLCRRCRFAEEKSTARSVFLLCRLSETDSRFARYPQLPVLACSGFEGRADSAVEDC